MYERLELLLFTFSFLFLLSFLSLLFGFLYAFTDIRIITDCAYFPIMCACVITSYVTSARLYLHLEDEESSK